MKGTCYQSLFFNLSYLFIYLFMYFPGYKSVGTAGIKFVLIFETLKNKHLEMSKLQLAGYVDVFTWTSSGCLDEQL